MNNELFVFAESFIILAKYVDNFYCVDVREKEIIVSVPPENISPNDYNRLVSQLGWLPVAGECFIYYTL